MAAKIRSLRNGLNPVDGASRDDLIMGDVVTVQALEVATTYYWTLVFAPEGSTATFSGSPSAVSPGTFTVDTEGAYLIRLVVDATLSTESIQYVRLRVLTAFGDLHLVAAGERRDGTGIIPVDVDTEGWANEQNANLQTLKAFIKPLVMSGRVLFVDANVGTSNYGDYSSIQDAIDYAVSQTPTVDSQWLIGVRPGLYTENLTLPEYVHVAGWPSNPEGRSVVVEGIHTAAPTTGSTTLAYIALENNTDSTSATLTKIGAGSLQTWLSRISSNGTLANQGAAVNVVAGIFQGMRSHFVQTFLGAADRVALQQSGPSTINLLNCSFEGPSGIALNTSGDPAGTTAIINDCQIYTSAGPGVTTLNNLTILSRCLIASAGVFVNQAGTGIGGNVHLEILYTTLYNGNLSFDVTGITGSTSLFMGSLSPSSINILFPGGPVDLERAQTLSRTNYYDNTTSGLTAENVQDAIDELVATPPLMALTYNKNMPAVPNDSVSYRGWVPLVSTLIAIRVRMMTVHTVGNYALTIVNENTGNTVLATPTTNLNGLTDGIVTPIALTATPSDLIFPALSGWNVTLTSDNPGFDGEDVYFELLFNTSTGGGSVTNDLATVLLVGNATGGTDIVVTDGDKIKGEDAPPLSGLDGKNLLLEGGAGDGAGLNGVVQIPALQIPTAPTAGWVFTSDASGNGSWQAVPGGVSGWTDLGAVVHTTTSTDQVVIGNTVPVGTEKFYVEGTANEPVGYFLYSGTPGVGTVQSFYVDARATAVNTGTTFVSSSVLGGSNGINDGSVFGHSITAYVQGASGIGSYLGALPIRAGKIDANGTGYGIHTIQPATIGGNPSFLDAHLRMEHQGGTLGNFWEAINPLSATVGSLDASGNLIVAGKMTGANLQVTTAPTSGWVLTSDAVGNATWQAPTGVACGWTDAGTVVHTTMNSDQVSIGGSVVGTEKFRVWGTSNLPVAFFNYSGTVGGSINVFTLSARPNSIAAGSFFNSLYLKTGSGGANDGTVRGLDIEALVWGTTGVGDNLTALRSKTAAIDANGTGYAAHLIQPATVGIFPSFLTSLLYMEHQGGTLGNFWEAKSAGSTKGALDPRGNLTVVGILEGDKLQVGSFSSAQRQNQTSMTGGRYAIDGDSQGGIVVFTRQSADATLTELTFDNAAPSGAVVETSNRFLLNDDSSVACEIQIQGVRTDGGGLGDTNVYMMRGKAKMVGGVATIGIWSTYYMDEDDNTWTTPTATLDAGGALHFDVAGPGAGAVIRWTAIMRFTETRF